MSSEAFNKFSQNTTIHGIVDIRNAKSIFWKIFWVVVMFACTALAVYEIYRIFEQYSNRPIITTYETKRLDNVPFPKVTVCLNHFVNRSRVEELKIAPTLINKLVLGSIEFAQVPLFLGPVFGDIYMPDVSHFPLLLAHNRHAALILASQHFDNKTFQMAQSELKSLFADETATDVDYFTLHYNKITSLLRNGRLDKNLLLDQIGFDLDKILVFCMFSNARNCSVIGRKVYDLIQETCFHLEVNESQTMAANGLFLIINTHYDLVWQDMVPASHGIYVKIQEEYSPFDHKALRIPAGTTADITMQPTRYHLTKSKKYAECTDSVDYYNFNYSGYSEGACRSDCLLQKILSQCSCGLTYNPSYFKSRFPMCATIEQLICISHFHGLKSTEPCVVKCKPPCQYWIYNPTVSYSHINSQPFGNWLNRHGKNPSQMNDIIHLHVYFSSLSYILIGQEDALTLDGFVSQIGGQLGLFLGASIISLVQMCYLLIQHIGQGFKEMPQKNTQK